MKKYIKISTTIEYIILIVSIVSLVFLIMDKKPVDTVVTGSRVTENVEDGGDTINSIYGFSFNVPGEWQIWEGVSASSEMLVTTNFIEDMNSDFTVYQKQKYQQFMNDWDVEYSSIITFSQGEDDYADRDIANAGIAQSRHVDSEEMINSKSITMYISNKVTDLNKESESSKVEETGLITIGEREARYYRINADWNIVNELWVLLPITSKEMLEGAPVSTLTFRKYVRKGDQDALDDLVDFIASMNIVIN